MKKQFSNLIPDIRLHAKSEYPDECCGLVLVKGRKHIYAPGVNERRGEGAVFRIDTAKTQLDYPGSKIAAIVHSHIDMQLEPSDADKAACRESELPWLIYNVPLHHLVELSPEDVTLPLLGRQFHWGVLDCLTLIRDAYREIGIEIRNYERGGELGCWENSEWDQYGKYVQQEGFVRLGDNESLRKYDLLLMATDKRRPLIGTHAGLFWDEQKHSFIHHSLNQLSQELVYGGYFADITIGRYRHKEIT